MTRAVEEWNDERLNDLAATLQPLPAQLAMLTAGVAHIDHLTAGFEPVPTQIAVLAASVEHLANENRVLRTELAAVERQLIQISWALAAAVLGAAAAVVGALV
jgi:prefoldin subunit 5